MTTERKELICDSLALKDVEKAAVEMALLLTKWDREAAAKILGISKTLINRKIKKYGLK